MEISEQDAEALLNNPKNYARVEYRKPHNGSRGKGSKEVPSILRELIGVSAHHDTIKKTAETFDVSPTTVAMAKKGNVGVNRHDPDLADAIEAQVEKREDSVRNTALDRLAGMFATVITDENLSAIQKPREAVAVAKDLAIISERVQDKRSSGPQVVFVNQVRVKSEEEYGEPIVLEHPKEER